MACLILTSSRPHIHCVLASYSFSHLDSLPSSVSFLSCVMSSFGSSFSLMNLLQTHHPLLPSQFPALISCFASFWHPYFICHTFFWLLDSLYSCLPTYVHLTFVDLQIRKVPHKHNQWATWKLMVYPSNVMHAFQFSIVCLFVFLMFNSIFRYWKCVLQHF